MLGFSYLEITEMLMPNISWQDNTCVVTLCDFGNLIAHTFRIRIP